MDYYSLIKNHMLMNKTISIQTYEAPDTSVIKIFTEQNFVVSRGSASLQSMEANGLMDDEDF